MLDIRYFANRELMCGTVPGAGAPTEVAAPSGGRANLLDAIRAAGGAGKAKLRNPKVRKVESKKKKEEVSGSGGGGGGDLMSDLAATLPMRRNGISGATGAPGGEGTGGGGGAMDRISAMIPPPPVPGGESGGGGTAAEETWD